MGANQKKISSSIFDLITSLNNRSESEHIHIEGLKINTIIIDDDYNLNQYYDKILAPNFDYSFSFNSIEAFLNTNQSQFNLIKNNIIEPLINGHKFNNEYSSFSTHKTVSFLIIKTKNIVNFMLKNSSVENYIINCFNQRRAISNIKLYTNNIDSFAEPENKHNNFSQIFEQINKNLSKEDFNVKTLSLKTGYSQRQLSRIISAEKNMTPAKYILELRLKKAHELLSSSNGLKIKEVKYSIGINSSSYFSKKFKDRFGYMPSEFNKKS